MATVLEGLRDIDGVAGSFAIDEEGDVFANAMPAYVAREELGKVAQRLQWVSEAAAELNTQESWCTLYFDNYHLQVVTFTGGKLVVLSEPSANSRALRMAAKLVCRKLERIIDGTSSRTTMPPPFVAARAESARSFEVRARGRLSEEIAEPAEVHNNELRNTQPSIAAPPVVKTTPSHDASPPEARSGRRAAASRSLVYRGRRYDVSG
jgi:predicted regulator of Ras-like GTPase activity (Roadblock/LC7/MglB family)